jgi:glutaredoxin-like YruB-family protein
MKTKNVTLYTTPTCAYCKMAKRYFKDNNIQYKEVDVAKNEQAAEEMVAKTGHLGVPQIFIGNEVVIGFDKPVLDHLLGIHA